MQQQKIILFAVFISILAVSVPACNGQKDIPNNSVPIDPSLNEQSTEGSTDTTQNKVPLDGRTLNGPSSLWLSRLLSQQVGGNLVPSFAVEVDEKNNDASLKIMHLPLTRTAYPAHSPDTTDLPLTQDADRINELRRVLAEKQDVSNLPKIRRTRDIEFKIYDQGVIKALIEALRKIDPSRADILERNIFRAKVKVEIDDDDDDDWYMRMKYALGMGVL